MDLSAVIGLDASRAVDPASYAMSGRAPGAAVRPANRDELVEAVRAAAGERLGVVPWGGGVALSWERAPERYDIALDLRGLAKIVEFEPEDLTLTAECGVTIEALRDAVAARGLELPMEAAKAWGATLGGTLAANASGPRRLLLGAPRDRILGARFVTGDGVAARSGGKVVKNVAGYGTHRLLCGSHGSLAVIVEASLKLQPAPEARAAMIYAMEAGDVADAARWARFPRMEPAVLSVVGSAIAMRNPVFAHGTAFTVVVGFEGDAPHVEAMCAATRDALGTPKLKLAGASALTLWQHLADLEELMGPRLTLTSATHTPAALAAWATGDGAGATGDGAGATGTGAGANTAAAGAPSRPPLDRAVFHAACGKLHVFPHGADVEDGAADAPSPDVDAMLLELHAKGFALTNARGLAALTPPSPPSSALRVLREQARQALDPNGTFALAR
ncbi:MAG TPA: FAD-binding oxidoreductase [Candidatus Saccharimonadaceae bacterium]|nr:FAD-binding oxidoreductase [Candidatus Saccharimonadaceae bacterium]